MSKLTDGVSNALESVSSEFGNVLSNPIYTAVGGAIVGGSIVGITAAAVSRKKSRPRKKKAVRRSTPKRRGARKRSPKYARTAGKRKDPSHRRIRMTKNGQPYVILASGKARFIKKSSARLSRKKKGGRY